ncbi:MAG TPA: rhomboid family intramembrane serine protease [Myxococcota bacterium]
MLPLRDENPTLGTSMATFAIIGVNVAVWIFVQGLGTEPALSTSVCELGAIPGDLLGTLPDGFAVPLGHGLECRIGGPPNWLSLLTSMFMHGGWFHIVGNLWFLSIFGDNVEDAMGPGRFTIFYLVCGLVAATAQVLSDPASPVPMVGASGAIGGVMGAYAVLYPRVPVRVLLFFGFFFTTVAVPAVAMLGFWFLLQVLGGIPALESEAGGVAFWAHVGGFLAGVALVFPFKDPVRLAAHRAHAAMLWARERR